MSLALWTAYIGDEVKAALKQMHLTKATEP